MIKSKSYLILYCGDGKESQYTDNDNSYVGFGLKDGESVVLTDSSGNIIDYVEIPENIESNLSYSRNPVGLSWAISLPTPGEKNKVYTESTYAKKMMMKLYLVKTQDFMMNQSHWNFLH